MLNSTTAFAQIILKLTAINEKIVEASKRLENDMPCNCIASLDNAVVDIWQLKKQVETLRTFVAEFTDEQK